MKLKGIVLAGGLGRRLTPMTNVTNKHLLDVYDEPMIFYPIRSLKEAGITEIVLVTGDQIPQFKTLLGDGKGLGVHLSYCYQEGERGIADALSKAEVLVGRDKSAVILGDNIFEDDLTPYVESFSRQKMGAKILLKEMETDEEVRRFGVPNFTPGGDLVDIIEKPLIVVDKLVVTGVYFYDHKVFSYIKQIKPSKRGELEVTDLNNKYISSSIMTWDIISGYWSDAGTPESKLRASLLAAKKKGFVVEK